MESKVQKSTIILVILAMLVSAIVFGSGGYYFALNQNTNGPMTQTLSSDKVASTTSPEVLTIGKGSLNDLANFREASLDADADSILKETHTEMTGVFKSVFSESKLVEDLEQKNESLQPNSLLIYAVSRMIEPDDLLSVKNELSKIGYNNIEVGKESIFAHKGTQYTSTVSLHLDVNDGGRFIIRVLVY